MEKQRWEESEKRREEERRSEKRKSQKNEDAGARKGRTVAKHCVFPMICGSGGSKSSMCFQFLKCLFKVCRIFLDCLVPWASGVHKEVLEVMGQLRDRIVFEHGVQALQQPRSPVDLQLHPKLSPPRRPWAFHQRRALTVVPEVAKGDLRQPLPTTKCIPVNYTAATTTTISASTTLQQQLPLDYNRNCNYTTLQLQLQLLLLLQLLQLQLQLHFQLHYHYNHNYNCTYNYTTTTTITTTTITLHFATPHYILQLWVTWPLQPLQKAQPPFGPSVGSVCHPCITTTHLSYSFLSLKLPPPPCAVLLVYNLSNQLSISDTYIIPSP